LLHKGFSVRSPRCLYSDPPVLRTSRCGDPSRCVMSLPVPRPGRQVSPLADAGLRVGDHTRSDRLALAQAARAKSVRLSAALIVVRRMVTEIIVAFLGTLPLDQQPESKPFTPFAAHDGRYGQG
jgi:hypothetical protein